MRSEARFPPNDLDAERSVLGGVLLDNATLDDVIELVSADDFYRAAHQRVFAAMVDLAGRREPIDVITLADELRRRGHLDEIGGTQFIAALDAAVPVTANVRNYARIVQDTAGLRRLAGAAQSIVRDVVDRKAGARELIEQAEQRIFGVADQRSAKGFTSMNATVRSAFSKLEVLYERQEEITGVATGLTGFDRMTAGLQKSDLIIVAGRPSMGKTAVVMNMAVEVAKMGPVAVFSLEMNADALTMRMFASEARVDGQRLRTGKLLDSDWPKLARAADRLHKAPIFIDDAAGLSALEMRAKCRRLKAREGGLALVVVDYLQLMKGSTSTDSREQEISEISRGLKALAKELEVPVIALSQLNRSLEKREDKRPQMSDLRESGALEQDADVICFIYRDEVYNRDTSDKGVAELIIAKQRNGPTGTVRVAFLRDYTRFENLEEGDR